MGRCGRKQLAQVELARAVGLDLGRQLNPVGNHAGEGRIGGYDGRGSADRQVVDIRCHE
jgi:hypothetical protein